MRTVPYFLIPEWKLATFADAPRVFIIRIFFSLICTRKKESPMNRTFSPGRSIFCEMRRTLWRTTGSNTVILREALEEIGGFPYGTVTEDFETSLRLQKAGVPHLCVCRGAGCRAVHDYRRKYDPAEDPLGQGRDPEHSEYQCDL